MMQTVAFKEQGKLLMGKLARNTGIAAVVLLLLSFAVSFRLPWWITWENGPVEMVQNAILAESVFLCLYYYVTDKKKGRADSPVSPGVWILGALIFLLLLGREISWGRIFFLEYIGKFGPEFTDQAKLPYYRFVRPFVAVLGGLILFGFYKWFPRRSVLLQVPFPVFPFAALCLCAALALLGDSGILKHVITNAAAIALEECTELIIYYLLLFLTWYYHKWFSYVKAEP